MRARIPNALSASRIVLAVLVILASVRLDVFTYVATICMLVLAAVTDALDGYLARRWGVASDRGYVLDTMGDRAIQLALVLVFLVRYSFHPLFAWLLIFRDIAIYAVRILSKDWLSQARHMRRIFLFHTTTLRLWLAMFVLRDGVRVFTHSDPFDGLSFEIIQFALLSLTLAVSYYGLFRTFNLLIDQDHET